MNTPDSGSRRPPAIPIVTLTGNLTVDSVPGVRKLVADHVATADEALILDLTAVTAMDAVGLSELLRIRRLRGHGSANLHLVLLAPDACAIFYLTGMHRIFLTHPTVEAAMRSAHLALSASNYSGLPVHDSAHLPRPTDAADEAG